jgi:hypothetical protein
MGDLKNHQTTSDFFFTMALFLRLIWGGQRVTTGQINDFVSSSGCQP